MNKHFFFSMAPRKKNAHKYEQLTLAALNTLKRLCLLCLDCFNAECPTCDLLKLIGLLDVVTAVVFLVSGFFYQVILQITQLLSY